MGLAALRARPAQRQHQRLQLAGGQLTDGLHDGRRDGRSGDDAGLQIRPLVTSPVWFPSVLDYFQLQVDVWSAAVPALTTARGG